MGVAKLLALAGLGAVLAFGKAAAQERIADDFNLEETVDICMACHGEDGVPIEADIPVLWGQQFYYLYVQMKDYKAGRRANEIMQPMVEGFTRDQMKALATYFSEKTWPGMPAAKDADKAKAGSAQTGAGQCAQCQRTMLEFKNKIRLNSAAKGSLMKSYEDTSLEQMAHFLATL
jgi:cytochrome c553